MMLMWFTAGLIAMVQSNKFSTKIRSTGSLLSKQIASGEYHKYMEMQRRHRITVSNDNGTEPLTGYSDELYVGTVAVGTPGQLVDLVFDTGSSNLWVIDSNCTSIPCQGRGVERHKFDPTKSATFTVDGRRFSIQYGTGSCSGYLGRDVLSFAGLQINSQGLGVATKLANLFAELPVDGIFGLGWPALAVQQVVPPMQNVLPQLDQPLFTVWLDRKVAPSQGESGGLITFGDFDDDNCYPTITYFPLTSETYWQFSLDAFSIGFYSRKMKQQAISDTGTSWIGMPRIVLQGIVRATGATYRFFLDLYTVPCNGMHYLPDMVFIIGHTQLHVPPVQYVLDVGIGDGTISNKFQCALTIFAMDSAGFAPQWILGDAFIRSYCNVYDIGNSRIGFARAIHHF